MFISIPIDVDLELKEEVVTGDLGTLLRQKTCRSVAAFLRWGR